MGSGKRRLWLIVGLVLVLAASFIPCSIISATAPEVTVSISPKSIEQKFGLEFTVDVTVTTVTNLAHFSFDVSYDPAVIRVTGTQGGEGVVAGRITDATVSPIVIKSIPITWVFDPSGTQGKITITGDLGTNPGLGASGTGYLARIRFAVVGAYGAASAITPQNAVMKPTGVTPLTIRKYVAGLETVPYPPVEVSIEAPASVPAGDELVARVNVSLVAGLSAFQFDLVYDPAVLRVKGEEGGEQGVSGGLIGTTPYPISMWLYYPHTGNPPVGVPGTIRVLGATADGSSATGPGYLADVTFEVIGVKDDSSDLLFTDQPPHFYNGLFSGDHAIAEVSWKGQKVNVLSPYRITTPSPLPIGEVGRPYSRTLAATGGAEPYTFSINEGSLPLPEGLTLDAGAITGTPLTAGGPTGVTFKVTDNEGVTTTKVLNITIAAPPEITTASPLPDGEAGLVYSKALSVTGGLSPYTWLTIAGSLPHGIALSPGGILSGTTSAAGTTAFTAKVTDRLGGTATREFSITFVLGLAITTPSPLPSGEVSIAYSKTLANIGGLSPFTWSIQSGALPPGLTLNSTTGAITGIPSLAGSPPAVTIKVVDSLLVEATKSFSINIVTRPTITTPSPLPGGETGAAYAFTLLASGGQSPFTWSVLIGNLPAGLTLDSASGAITGTPTVTQGPAAITFKVKDKLGGTATKALTLTIIPGLSINTPSPLPGGEVGLAYTKNLAASGGKTPYTWSIASGALPAGLSLNSNSGAITGKPATAGTFTVTFKVADNLGNITKDFSLFIAPAPSISTVSPLSDGQAGLAYSQTLAATDGQPPYKWSISSGSLPSGLTLNLTTGTITGKPTAAGSKTLTFKVTDSMGGAQTQALSITIVAAPSISTRSPLPGGEVGLGYWQTLAATGGKTPYTWSISSGAWPAGLVLDSATGAITGKPAATGTFAVTYRVTDDMGGTKTKPISLTIAPALSITNLSPLPGGEVGLAYTGRLTAGGGKTPYKWSISSGALPAGLVLNSTTGAITGKPTAAGGPYTITFAVADALGGNTAATLLLTISPRPVILTPSPLPTGEVGLAYWQTLAGTGGKPPYKWSLGSGSLPSGLTLTSTTGIIAGKPSGAGLKTLTLKVTDSLGGFATQAVTLKILARPLITTSSPLIAGKVGLPYSRVLAVSGGQPPYTWTLQTGTLPAGLSLDPASGAITGTPTAASSTVSLTFRVTDDLGGTAVKSLSLKISP